MAQIQFLDKLLHEYLIFRGFTNTIKTLDNEQRNEKDQSFRAEKIMEQFNYCINHNDLQGLLNLWKHLDANLFCKLEHNYAMAVKKLENSLLKLYLVTAYNHNKTEQIREFFTKLASELQQQSEWKDWFYFPFCRNPEESQPFSLYFKKEWQETFHLSLRNFLATIYQCMPQPTFVRVEQEAALIRRLQEENALLKSRLQQQSASQSSQNLNNPNSSSVGGPGIESRRRSSYRPLQSLSDILPFDVSPPGHLVDDFCIIATEVNSVTQASDAQARGLKMLIRNIGSSGSPVMGRKDNGEKSSKRRSGSVGRNWM
ncbi:WD repeat-containing protein 91 [Haematobia irritans]|uniref:WD repeat-containing protein 91 n=1 Tax=Haematobia irritans TaxID=7368 RepID=UPI003F503086